MKLHDFIINPRTGRMYSSAARSQVVEITEASVYYENETSFRYSRFV